MFGVRPPPENRLIDKGRVSCPLRDADVDFELCLQCNWARRIDPEAKPPYVRCRPPGKLLLLP
jgi:hypothetical protein